MGIAALAISKGCGKGGRPDSLIVRSSTLSIRPSFPPLFWQIVEINLNSLSHIQNNGTERSATKLWSSWVGDSAISHQSR